MDPLCVVVPDVDRHRSPDDAGPAISHVGADGVDRAFELAGALAYARDMSEFHDLTMTSITGSDVSFSDFAGQACLVVNVASR